MKRVFQVFVGWVCFVSVSIGFGVNCDPELPDRLNELRRGSNSVWGPNGYNAVLFRYYEWMEQRHVGYSEFIYLLSRDFKLVRTLKRGKRGFGYRRLKSGDVVVFDQHKHVAYYLGRGWVFDQWRLPGFFDYRSISINDAHKGLVGQSHVKSGVKTNLYGKTDDITVPPEKHTEPFRRLQVFRYRGLHHSLAPTTLPPDFVMDAQVARVMSKTLVDIMNQSKRGRRFGFEALLDTAKGIGDRFLGRIGAFGSGRRNKILTIDRAWGSTNVEVMFKMVSLVETFGEFLGTRSFRGGPMTGGGHNSGPVDVDAFHPFVGYIAGFVWETFGFDVFFSKKDGAKLMLAELKNRMESVAPSTLDLVEIAQAVSYRYGAVDDE